MEEEYLRDYLSGLRCGKCGEQCKPDNITLLNRVGDSWTFSVYCECCKKQGILCAVVKKAEVSEAGPELHPALAMAGPQLHPELAMAGPQLHPELTMAEIDNFCTPVSSDDVLDISTFLKDFDGDFSALFPDTVP